MLTTAMFVPVPIFLVVMLLNNIAWASEATSALPASSVILIIVLWIAIVVPLTIFGGIAGRSRIEETLNDVGYRLPKL